MSGPNFQFQLPGESPVYSHINGRLDEVPPHELEIPQTRVQSACLEPTQNHANEIVNPNVESSFGSKRRKLRSKVWDDFINHTDKEGKVWATCKQCKKNFDGSSSNGTSHLKKHLESCRSRKSNNGTGDKQAGHEKGSIRNPVVHGDKFVINQELNQLDVVRTIIKFGFSRMNFIKPDILRVYSEEKEKLSKYLRKLSCCFSLTGQLVDDHGILIVLHFINEDWELKQKAISFHSYYDESWVENVKKSLLDLHVDENICSGVTDSKEGEKLMEEMSNWDTKPGSLRFLGPLFSASYIESNVTSGIRGEIFSYIHSVRECFEYVHQPSKRYLFQTAVEKAKSEGKKMTSRSIPMVPLNSYSFLEELEVAIGYKAAFYELKQIDSEFQMVNLSTKEWDDTEAVYQFWKELNVAFYSLSATKCHTANAFFPKFCDIYLKLLTGETNGNHAVHQMASRAIPEFNNYWSNYKLVLAIAVFLDPRFKMDIIVRWYRKIYGDGAGRHIEEIVDVVANVCREYLNASSEMLDELGMRLLFQKLMILICI